MIMCALSAGPVATEGCSSSLPRLSLPQVFIFLSQIYKHLPSLQSCLLILLVVQYTLGSQRGVGNSGE
jgi:hypothetical protein